jgi:acetyl esterase/lipase
MGMVVSLGVTELLPVDGELDLTVTGLRPGAVVTVTATMKDPEGLRWHSEAEFAAGADGTVAVARTAPSRGSYSGADGNGLLWSMQPEQRAAAESSGLASGLAPLDIEFRAAVGGAAAGTARVTVQRESPGTGRRAVTDAGLRGTLFVPAGTGPFPPVLVLGGSGGSANEGVAAILAGHGYLALALWYFAAPGLPAELVDIELEYFGRALSWLRRQPEAAPGRTAVVGRSRGGELALLLGLYLGVDTVVAFVPSGIVFSGIRRGPDGWLDVPAWRWDGRPLPYLYDGADGTADQDGVISETPAVLAALADWDRVRAATMPLQDCRSSVLLLSGCADQVWPSALLAELAMARLRLRSSGRQRHLAMPGAGHRFLPPTLPATVSVIRHPADGERTALGGTAAANARAGRLAHAAMLSALDGRIEDTGIEEEA